MPLTVEYSLTSVGRTLTEPLEAIRCWAEQHIEKVLAARSRNREKWKASPATPELR